MNWQEYQNAVGELYLQMEGLGDVRKNITFPDKVTGQARQVDVWIDIEAKNHKIGVLVDAKFRKEKIDVKDIEEVLSLASAVGANKAVLVASSGWTEPAEVKANHSGVDLLLWTLEEALDLMVPDKWIMCSVCENDCIVLDRSGGMVVDGMWSLLTAGQCRECNAGLILCWACGERILLENEDEAECSCEHLWKCSASDLFVRPVGDEDWSVIPR
jgi:hypothetical protein